MDQISKIGKNFCHHQVYLENKVLVKCLIAIFKDSHWLTILTDFGTKGSKYAV